jgi:hypothetical protein
MYQSPLETQITNQMKLPGEFNPKSRSLVKFATMQAVMCACVLAIELVILDIDRSSVIYPFTLFPILEQV